MNHHGFSTVDGFVKVNEGVVEMLKYLANEPSVGLYYIQQHTHNVVPNLLHLNGKVVDRSHETTLHAEDLEDSITLVRSMKQCGIPIADEMVKDINKSLMIMSTSQPRRGLIRNSSSGFEKKNKSGSWAPVAFGYGEVGAQQDGEGSGSYFSSVLKSAKQKATGIRWPQLDPNQSSSVVIDQKLQFPNPTLPQVAAASAVSTLPVPEAEELPLSSQIVDEQHDEYSPTHEMSSENYEEFKVDREAKLKECLEEHESLNGSEGKFVK